MLALRLTITEQTALGPAPGNSLPPPRKKDRRTILPVPLLFLNFFQKRQGNHPVIIRLGQTYLKSKRKRISKKINKSLLTPTPGNPGRIPSDI